MRRLMMWCQHSLGMGHLVRSYALAAGLAERFDVLLVVGGHLPEAIPVPAGVQLLELPPVAAADGAWTTIGSDRARMASRAEALVAAFDAHHPDVLVLELFPFGRKRFTGELVELLLHAHARPGGRPYVASSVRDILVGARRDQRRHERRARFIAERWFDVVLVHGDPALGAFADTFAEPLATPVAPHRLRDGGPARGSGRRARPDPRLGWRRRRRRAAADGGARRAAPAGR